jgi:hypothetical protein
MILRIPKARTKEEARAIIKGAKAPTRPRSEHVELDGHMFDSKKEAARYLLLKDMERRGEIVNLIVHPSYPLRVKGMKVTTYEGDFSYERRLVQGDDVPLRAAGKWQLVVEDVKGYTGKKAGGGSKKTEAYRQFELKRNLVKALYGVIIEETY